MGDTNGKALDELLAEYGRHAEASRRERELANQVVIDMLDRLASLVKGEPTECDDELSRFRRFVWGDADADLYYQLVNASWELNKRGVWTGIRADDAVEMHLVDRGEGVLTVGMMRLSEPDEAISDCDANMELPKRLVGLKTQEQVDAVYEEAERVAREAVRRNGLDELRRKQRRCDELRLELQENPAYREYVALSRELRNVR